MEEARQQIPGIANVCTMCPYKESFELSRVIQRAGDDLRRLSDENKRLNELVTKLEEKLKRLESE